MWRASASSCTSTASLRLHHSGRAYGGFGVMPTPFLPWMALEYLDQISNQGLLYRPIVLSFHVVHNGP